MSAEKIVVFVAVTGLLMTTEAFLFGVPEPELPIKLYRGNETSGVLMVYINGVWGTVCDDMWDDEDARVVCRQLGLEGSTHVNRAPERFGIKIYADNNLRTKRILLTDVRCDGSELSLFDCLYFNETITCDHDEDAGVICHPRQMSWGDSTKRVVAPPGYTDSPVHQDKPADDDQNITGFTETSVLRTAEVRVNEWGNARLESVSVAPSTGYAATRASNYPTDSHHVTSGVECHLLNNLLYSVLFVTWVTI